MRTVDDGNVEPGSYKQLAETACSTVEALLLESLLAAFAFALTGWTHTFEPVGTADVRYLHHSSWVVNTSSHTLVFDYVEHLPWGGALADSLRLNRQSFGARSVLVFVTHSHGDHFDAAIRKWAGGPADVQYFVGSPDLGLPNATFLRPRENWSGDGVEVRTTGSTDDGVGFLVTVDGVTIFHAGDHARWVEPLDTDFMAEINWLKASRVPIDIAMFPIATGAACEARASIRTGVRRATEILAPRVLFPMHIGCADRLGEYEKFREEVGPRLPATQVVSPKREGEFFAYANGTIRR